MIKRTLISVALIILCSIHIQAQESEIKSPDDLIKEFFELIKSNKADKAVEYIFSTNPWMKGADGVKQSMEDIKKYTSQLGEFYGQEKLSKATAGSNIVAFSYLGKFSRQPLRFVFTFYKPKDQWQIYYFKYDDAIADELLEAIAVYRLGENLKIDGY